MFKKNYLIRTFEVKIFEVHSYDVYSVNFSPDGKYIASGGWDNTIKIWLTPQKKEGGKYGK
jgi:WD40 repeat protein